MDDDLVALVDWLVWAYPGPRAYVLARKFHLVEDPDCARLVDELVLVRPLALRPDGTEAEVECLLLDVLDLPPQGPVSISPHRREVEQLEQLLAERGWKRRQRLMIRPSDGSAIT